MGIEGIIEVAETSTVSIIYYKSSVIDTCI